MLSWIRNVVKPSSTNSNTSLSRSLSAPDDNVDKESWRKVEKARKEAAEIIKEWRPINELKETLRHSPSLSDTVNLRDGQGYTLLQHAIIVNRVNVTCLLVNLGAEVNNVICGRPLHLAAKLGHVEIMRLLLDRGADGEVTSSVCYPDSHHHAKHMYNPTVQRWTICCEGDICSPDKLGHVTFDFPLYYALNSKKIEGVHLLVQRNICTLADKMLPLHLACRFGFGQGIEFFADLSPDDINVRNGESKLPIDYAMQYCRHFVEILVQKGSSVMLKNKQTQQTLLHSLFENGEDEETVLDVLDYLLTCGVGIYVNALDSNGDSCLHSFARYARRTCHTSRHNQCRSYDNIAEDLAMQLQQALDKSETILLLCMRRLIEAGTNMNIRNRVGDSCLHLLSRIPVPRHEKELGFSHNRNSSISVASKLIECILENNANPNFLNNCESSVLVSYMTQVSAALFEQKAKGPVTVLKTPSATELDMVVKTLNKLQLYGCHFQHPRYVFTTSECLIHIVLEHLKELDKVTTLPPVAEQAQVYESTREFLRAVYTILEALFRRGCVPNSCRYPQCDLQLMYYKLMKHNYCVKHDTVVEFLLLFLQYGANANLGGKHIPMSVLRYRATDNWPTFPFLHILNRVANANDRVDAAKPHIIMEIMFCAMDYAQASQCIQNYLDFDRKRFNVHKSDKTASLDRQMEHLLCNPLRLRHMAATSVYISLGRKMYLVRKMSLPPTLAKMLLSFQFS